MDEYFSTHLDSTSTRWCTHTYIDTYVHICNIFGFGANKH